MNKIYIDMDGVLAKWNPDASIEETAMPGYFLNREPEEKAVRMVKNLVANGYDICILSSVYQDDHSEADKKVWLYSVGLGNLDYIFVPYGRNKREFVTKVVGGSAFLVDDFTKNLKEFEDEEAGFYGIKFLNGINGKKGTWDGYVISNRSTTEKMTKTVMGIVNQY